MYFAVQLGVSVSLWLKIRVHPSHPWLKIFPARIDCQTKPSLFTWRVQFEFFRNLTKRFAPDDSLESLEVGGRKLPLVLVRHPRARRYLLRLTPDGSARVTIPRGGSATEARRFAERSKTWLEQALQRQAARPVRSRLWEGGTNILFRGETVVIEIATGVAGNAIRFGSEVVKVAALV